MRILVVDDDELLFEVLREWLSGHELELATGANVALQKFTSGKYYDLVIIDGRMPDVDGVSLAERLPRRQRIIAFTAYDKYAEQFKRMGIPVLSKNMDFSTLGNRLCEMVSSLYIEPFRVAYAA